MAGYSKASELAFGSALQKKRDLIGEDLLQSAEEEFSRFAE